MVSNNLCDKLTSKADINSNAPRATATIMEVAHVASRAGRWNSSPGITTVYSRFSLNLVNGVEELSATSGAVVELVMASGSDLLRRP